MSKALLFGIVAGEKSGDILGAGLIAELRKRYPEAKFVGIGGPDMIAQGCESLAAMDRLSVMGFVEPLGRLPELFALKKRLRNFFIENSIAAFIGIDNPDFNLRLESELHQHNIKTVHYVSPSVWAYREKRIYKIKKSVDLMLTLFPFETAIYQQHGIAVKCVGHPLADSIGFEDQKQLHRQKYDLAADDAVVALMPGSRGGEIKRLGPIFLAAAIESLRDYPQLRFLIPFSSAEAKIRINALLKASNIFPSEQFQLVDDSHAAISAADLVVLASGTATLETLLLRRPMIVGYKLASLTYAIASRLVKIPYVALPNLLAGRPLVPEYIQHNLTATGLRDEIMKFMQDVKAHEPLLEEFDAIHHSLRLDASKQAAAAIAALLEGDKH
ncbi:MAG: lipid-A-disaccharide synthase [Pseudohongiella sp.]|jgi:lipid-A-disaccharide synthase|nr:lipid-A-disaccharide synthase [Pseudohongiella sp.]